MVAAVAVSLSMAAQAQTQDSDGKKAGRIVSQPVRDVGISKSKVPPVLQAASENPYALRQTQSCGQIAAAIRELNGPLGPDFGTGSAANEHRASVAEVGGSAVVNSLIPFRGVVREVSGAASADRRLSAAVDAGIARRGFLRGLQQGRRCKA
jgi:hypothetical protein